MSRMNGKKKNTHTHTRGQYLTTFMRNFFLFSAYKRKRGLRVHDIRPVGNSMKHLPMKATFQLAVGQHIQKNDLSGDEGDMGRLRRPEEEMPVTVPVGCRSSEALA